jgi:hypothetical protein
MSHPEDVLLKQLEAEIAHKRKVLKAVDRLISALEEYAALMRKEPREAEVIEIKAKRKAR